MKQQLAGIALGPGQRKPDPKVIKPPPGPGPQGLDPESGRQASPKKSEDTQNQKTTIIRTQTHQSSRHYQSERTLVF